MLAQEQDVNLQLSATVSNENHDVLQKSTSIPVSCLSTWVLPSKLRIHVS